MIQKSQVLSTVQQIKLRKLELAVQALLEQVTGETDSEKMEMSLIKTGIDRPIQPFTSIT